MISALARRTCFIPRGVVAWAAFRRQKSLEVLPGHPRPGRRPSRRGQPEARRPVTPPIASHGVSYAFAMAKARRVDAIGAKIRRRAKGERGGREAQGGVPTVSRIRPLGCSNGCWAFRAATWHFQQCPVPVAVATRRSPVYLASRIQSSVCPICSGSQPSASVPTPPASAGIWHLAPPRGSGRRFQPAKTGIAQPVADESFLLWWSWSSGRTSRQGLRRTGFGSAEAAQRRTLTVPTHNWGTGWRTLSVSQSSFGAGRT